MTIDVDSFLADTGLGGTTLTHAERTLEDLMNEMSVEKKDLFALIVGAAIDNQSLTDDADVVSAYEALTNEEKVLLDFVVGNVLAEQAINHTLMDVENFLSHFGVKGMKWGVRNDDRGGSSSRGSKDSAAMKTAGHRAINALTGDKTFWKRMAVTAGISATALALPVAGAWVLPAGILGAIGSTGLATTLGTAGPLSSLVLSNADLGARALVGVGLYTSASVAAVGTRLNVRANTKRALAGSDDRALEAVGKALKERMSRGNQRVNKTVKGSSAVKHGVDLGDFLKSHSGTAFSELP